MNTDSVRSLFAMFSGQPADESTAPLVTLAVERVSSFLLPEADPEDVRLDFLCAAEANFRYQQIKAARGAEEYTYAGKLSKNGQTTALTCAESLLRDYYQLCEDLIRPQTFTFMTTGKEAEPCSPRS
ncbi:MAG: hypothetical protein KBI35_04970 [Ruminococcus sp.]|nr:hypothetical protein [Ruminococcus sp.]MBP8593758.1 hypothetical protein [Ruminococcus sp.]MBQ8123919.1 hypothetical protein [Ruminococcus sp.]HBB19753.1 hypothetical protein [Ruminococcus sp.]HOO06872.1 hypothetical protein [Ruminococcus sp.]